MLRTIYADGRYTVTAGSIATTSRFYPIANTTAMIRRDPLWAGLATAALAAATLTVYGDLLHPAERLVAALIATIGIGVGVEARILRIDALGHRPATIIARRRRVLALYHAIREAHDGAARPVTPLSGENTFRSEQ